MSFQIEKVSAPATAADVASVAIASVIALRSVNIALHHITMKVGSNPAIDEQIADINNQANKLSAIFTELTGWTSDEG